MIAASLISPARDTRDLSPCSLWAHHCVGNWHSKQCAVKDRRDAAADYVASLGKLPVPEHNEHCYL